MDTRKAAILLVAVVLVWGVNWTVTKIIVSAMPPVWSTAIRTLIAVSALFVLQGATRTLTVPRPRDFPLIGVVAVFHMTLFAVCMATGLQYISVGRSIVLGYTTPLWVAPLAWLLLGEPMPARRVAGIALGLLGLAVLVNPAALDWNDSRVLFGNGLLLLAAMSWAVAILCIKAFTWHSTPFQLSPWQNLFAASLMIPLALCLEGPLDVTPGPTLCAALAFSGLVATAFGFWAISVVNTRFSATTTSLALLATPIVGIASSLIILGETIDLSLVVAGGMIFGGIVLGTAIHKPGTRQKP